jgi:hypothetical protein
VKGFEGFGVSALLGKAVPKKAPTASAANPNLAIVFICMFSFASALLRPHKLKPRTDQNPQEK